MCSRVSPWANMVTRGVGIQRSVAVDTLVFDIVENDTVLSLIQVQPAPTASEWGLIILGGLLAAAAFVLLRRRTLVTA